MEKTDASDEVTKPQRRALLTWVGSALMLGACGSEAADEREPSGSATNLTQDLRVACPVITQFPAIVDLGARSSFTRMDRGDQLQWLVTGVSAAQYALQLPDCVLTMLRGLDAVHFGHPISMLGHSLQVATRAKNANASDDLILAALCHHIGALLTVEGQAELSAAILRGFISEHAYQVLRHHSEYQWSVYGDRAGLPTTERARYASQPWHRDAERFCDEWDCLGYEPGFRSLTLADLEPLVRAKLGPDSGYLVGQLTSSDCV